MKMETGMKMEIEMEIEMEIKMQIPMQIPMQGQAPMQVHGPKPLRQTYLNLLKPIQS